MDHVLLHRLAARTRKDPTVWGCGAGPASLGRCGDVLLSSVFFSSPWALGVLQRALGGFLVDARFLPPFGASSDCQEKHGICFFMFPRFCV